MNCCNDYKLIESIQVFKNGTQHIRKNCETCGKFLGYKQQEIDPEKYIFHFGKYKGKKLIDVEEHYLNWLRNQDWVKNNLKTAINNYLSF
tara:strand:+ start:1223 stop:1492 length:270 start_codon:yes stop_codon:yes gene_type:complete